MPPRGARRAQKKGDQDRLKIDLNVDGATYRFDTAEITYVHEMALWAQAKLTMIEVLKALDDDKPALFFIAAIVFLARQSTEGDPPTFDAIAQALTLSSDIEVKVLGDEEDQAPEDPAAN